MSKIRNIKDFALNSNWSFVISKAFKLQIDHQLIKFWNWIRLSGKICFNSYKLWLRHFKIFRFHGRLRHSILPGLSEERVEKQFPWKTCHLSCTKRETFVTLTHNTSDSHFRKTVQFPLTMKTGIQIFDGNVKFCAQCHLRISDKREFITRIEAFK